MLRLYWGFAHCHKSGAKEDIAVLAEIKQVEIKHIKIPAADALGFDAVMAIYQALRPIMPAAGRDGACQTAPRLMDILDEFDGLVLDGFGVINIGDGPIEGIKTLLDAAASKAKPVLVLTNGGSFSAERAFAKYQDWQLPIKRDDVLSSRDALVAQLAGSPEAPLANNDVIGCFGRVIEPLAGKNIITYGHDDDFWNRADVFVFLGAIEWGESDQAAFEAGMMARPRPVHIANPDVTAPQANDWFSAEPGYWTARMIHQAAIRAIEVDVRWYGKPYQPAFDLALARMARLLEQPLNRKRIAMVGDSLHTDILGGNAAGMTSVLVTDYGLFRSHAALPYCMACDIRPDWLVNSL
jgi:glycerol-1-phosphatase